MPAINEILQQGRYRIIHQSGQDDIGAVYEAYDKVLEKNVALKEILVSLQKVTTVTQQETRKLAFANEAKMLTQIKHQSLLPIHDYFSVIDRHFLVMEMVDGNSLNELIEKSKNPFPIADVIRWADQLLDALNYLHTYPTPFIHRAIKPENIKLTVNNQIKLIVFGNAKNSDAKVNEAIKNQSFDSVDLHYLPLEQIWDGLDPASQKVILNSYDEKSEKILEQPADARSDIYALGATLYHLITAHSPVDALTRSIDTLEGKPDPLKSPNQLNPTVPREISDILMKAMEIKRENRFDSAVIMRHIMRSAVTRVREREAEEMKKQKETAALELRIAEEKRLEQERQAVEQQRLEIEAEKKSLEQEKQRFEQERIAIEVEKNRQAQQRISETQTSESRQSFAEVDKYSLEKESRQYGDEIILELDDSEVLDLKDDKSLKNASAFENLSQGKQSAESFSEIIESNAGQKAVTDEYLFTESPKDKRSLKGIAIAAVVLLIFGGAGFGIWSVMSSKPAASNQMTLNQTVSSNDTVIPTEKVESTPPAPAAETTPETKMAVTTSATPATIESNVKTAAVKNKPVAPPVSQPTAQPKQTPPPKTAVNQKKPVTVDDIINDN